MRGGTRRMWSRRILRAGWLIAPLFTLPGKVFGGIRRLGRAIFFDYYGKFETGMVIFFTGFLIAIGLFIHAVISQSNKYSRPAESDVIKESMVDPCVRDKLLTRLNTGMIRQYDIDSASDACENEREQAKQQQMLEQQRQMLGVK